MMAHYTYLLLLIISLISCKKDDTGMTFSLPAKTQSGKHNFGFLLNSSVWTNYGQVCFPFAGGCRENLKGFYYPSDGDIVISADRVLNRNGSRNTTETININLTTNFQGLKTYSTLFNDTIGFGYWLSEQGQADKTYLLSLVNPTFTITLTKIDTTQKILSGEFSGILFRRLSETSFATSLTDSIIISDGRFDIKIK